MTNPRDGRKLPSETAASASAAILGWVHIVIEIFQTFAQLVVTLLTLVVEIGGAGSSARAAHCLGRVVALGRQLDEGLGCPCQRRLGRAGPAGRCCRPGLGGLAPSTYVVLDVPIGNFWWQLAAVSLAVLLALFCGWVQGVFGWCRRKSICSRWSRPPRAITATNPGKFLLQW